MLNNHIQQRIYFRRFIFLLTIILVNLNCKKQQEVVPNVSVNIYLSASDPNFINLNAVGGSAYITGGARGIIVYRKSSTEFMAYDRNCTYMPTNPCARVDIDKSTIMATDSCCGSKFLLTDGTVAKGPATIPLKSYRTDFDGNVLHIY